MSKIKLGYQVIFRVKWLITSITNKIKRRSAFQTLFQEFMYAIFFLMSNCSVTTSINFCNRLNNTGRMPDRKVLAALHALPLLVSSLRRCY